MLDRLEFSDWQLAQAMEEACHLSPSRAFSSSFSIGSCSWYDVLLVPVKTSLTRLEDEK